ncbi:FAD-dependent oxidoreductase [Allokutzneria albata]|uniref:2-polyprenyl-6-methoxyphenol hydroxylase n=1 Tax=Allokutzneria albata TaxID=211114 RepID=A0A1G9XHP7_ALLAB|nr:FAD-dependent oxidoreductase [Allokutzneria albata]SDM96339.1 2-polyprenyl-6-methoxyphenol hydroxylase [Allokutzneria albata]
MERTTCVIAGGGPAGMVLGLLLARAGVEVTVLEKHADFLRDFRGDTVHPSTLTLLDELGLGERFEQVPHRKVDRMQVMLDSGIAPFGDLSRIPGKHKHIAFVPQWDFLDLIAAAGKEEPTFTLRMSTSVTRLVKRGGKVAGVEYRTADGRTGELHADLVVACDGRHSTARTGAGLKSRSFGVPMDVWWFGLPRKADDPTGGLGRFSRGEVAVLIDRGEYFQTAYLIRKGSDAQVRAEGIEAFRRRVVRLIPWLEDRIDSVESLEDVKLLDVKLERLTRWHTDGLLCIGDAAHAMSPVGGVGINLAVQDAVAAARILAGPLRRGTLSTKDLAKVQRRRWLPTALTQGMQRVVHKQVLGKTLGAQPQGTPRVSRLPLPLRLIQRFPWLQAIPATLVGVGVLPEHAPDFARR